MTVQRLLTLIDLVLVTLAAWLAVQIIYLPLNQPAVPISGPVSDRKPRPLQQTAAPGNRLGPLSAYRTVIERNLFGTKAQANLPPPKTIDLAGLEQTRLQLKLWGTVAGGDQKAYAVIEDLKQRRQNLYHVGDQVQNATIKLIMREKVVLSVNGKDEILEMEKLQAGSSGRVFSPSAVATGGSVPRSRQRISLKRSLIEQSVQNIGKLMTQVKIHPYLEGGQPAGLALSNIQPNSIFRRMGLRNGDVLVGVNGQEIRSVDDALQLYEGMKNADSVMVDIKRRGRLRRIEYTIR